MKDIDVREGRSEPPDSSVR